MKRMIFAAIAGLMLLTACSPSPIPPADYTVFRVNYNTPPYSDSASVQVWPTNTTMGGWHSRNVNYDESTRRVLVNYTPGCAANECDHETHTLNATEWRAYNQHAPTIYVRRVGRWHIEIALPANWTETEAWRMKNAK